MWSQVALNLSVLTACIPSLKVVIDSLFGSVAVVTIDAPYRLARDSGDGVLRATATNTQLNSWGRGSSYANRGKNKLSSRGRLGEDPTHSSTGPVALANIGGSRIETLPNRSESTRHLTETPTFKGDGFETQSGYSQDGSRDDVCDP